ncbi:MAG TPA: hypothetical protein VMN39_10690 [Longimicrobiaceae bacterium]|nr:hypothetical protein [Longimicrobiaceae bacterium]
MIPPFVPRRAAAATTNPAAHMVPPLRIRGEQEAGAPAPERMMVEHAQPEASHQAEDGLPWLVDSMAVSGKTVEVAEETAPPMSSPPVPSLEGVREVELSDEWETDQLASIDPEDDVADPTSVSNADLFGDWLDELESVASRSGPPEMPPPSAAPSAAADPSRVEEVADRLEHIARALRERGPGGPLSDARSDPLGALIAAYLLGLSEGSPGGEK